MEFPNTRVPLHFSLGNAMALSGYLTSLGLSSETSHESLENLLPVCESNLHLDTMPPVEATLHFRKKNTITPEENQ